MSICVPHSNVPSVPRHHKRLSEPLDLELQMVVSSHVGLNSGLLEEQLVLVTAEPFLQPPTNKVLGTELNPQH